LSHKLPVVPVMQKGIRMMADIAQRGVAQPVPASASTLPPTAAITANSTASENWIVERCWPLLVEIGNVHKIVG
jgi:hypothetical protein